MLDLQSIRAQFYPISGILSSSHAFSSFGLHFLSAVDETEQGYLLCSCTGSSASLAQMLGFADYASVHLQAVADTMFL